MPRVTIQNAATFSIRSASLLLALWAMPATTRGQIFVTNPFPAPDGSVGKYTTSGATVMAPLVTGLNDPTGIAVSGENLFVTNSLSGTVGEYNATTGAIVNPSLITGLIDPIGIVVSGGNLFVVNYGTRNGVTSSNPNGDGTSNGYIGEYNATSGATVNASLITGVSAPGAVAISGENLFVTQNLGRGPNLGTVGEYTTSGTTVNPSLISGLNGPLGIAVSGDSVFVAVGGFIGEYTTSGTTVNDKLIQDGNAVPGIAVSGVNLFIVNSFFRTIGEYTTSGTTVNPSLISGLNGPYGIAVVPEPSSLVLAAFGFIGLAAWRLLRLGRRDLFDGSKQKI